MCLMCRMFQEHMGHICLGACAACAPMRCACWAQTEEKYSGCVERIVRFSKSPVCGKTSALIKNSAPPVPRQTLPLVRRPKCRRCERLPRIRLFVG